MAKQPRPLTTDAQDKAATAAIQLLAQSLVDPNSAMAEMARALNRDEAMSGRPRKMGAEHMQNSLDKFNERKPETGTFTKAMELFSGKLLAVLGPLAILGGVLSSAGSGFGVLVSAMNLLIAVLAPVLLPLFVVLAVAVAEFARTIMPHMMNAMQSITEFMLNYVLPVLQTLAQVVGSVIGFLVDFGAGLVSAASTVLGWAGDVGDWLWEKGGDVADAVGDAFSFGGSSTSGAAGMGVADIAKAAVAAVKGGDFAGESGAGGGWDDAGPAAKLPPDVAAKIAAGEKAGKAGDADLLGTIILSLEKSIGPKAQITGISQAFKNAQLAALNADPLEQMAQRAILESLQNLKQIAANTKGGGVGV
jgi:hypothetical protein